MTTSGPVVHQQLMNAYAEAQARLEEERAKTGRFHDARDGLNDDRSNALVSLAEHYLPELTREAIETTWSEIKPRVSNLLLQKEDHQRRVQNQLEVARSEHSEREKEFMTLTETIDQATDKRNELAGQVERKLQSDEKFVQLADRAAVAEAALERAEANLNEIDQDAARKLPAYEKSKLFRYLYDQGFGTEGYGKRGFTRRMDRALARFIGFGKAKQGYEFLRKTPDQMRRIIAEDRDDLDTVMDELVRRRDIVAQEFGLPASVREVESLDKQREVQLQKIGSLDSKIRSSCDELAELESTQGPYYREAIRAFRELLEKHDLHELQRRADATAELTDDQIVARLAGVDIEIEHLDDQTKDQMKRIDQMRESISELGRLVQRFRAAQFDSKRSNFIGSLDIMEEFQQAMDKGDIDQLWQRVRRAQRWGDVDDRPPMMAVLVNAMSDAAGSKSDHARRAGQRRARRDAQDNSGASWDGDSSRD